MPPLDDVTTPGSQYTHRVVCGSIWSEYTEERMSIASNFTTDEWNVLVETPIMAGRAVIFSSPSGPVGLV
jgi:hypothetical protein